MSYLSTGAVVVQVHERARIFFELASVEEHSRESKSVAYVGAAASPLEDASDRPGRPSVTSAGPDAASSPADSRANTDHVGERCVGLGLVATTAHQITKTARLRDGVRYRS